MKLSDLFEIQRKLDLILRVLGTDPDFDKPKEMYCLVTPDLWLFFRGSYHDCLDCLAGTHGIQLDMMTLGAYNQALDKAGYEPIEI